LILYSIFRVNMVVMYGNFTLGSGSRTDDPKIHIFQCMLEQTDDVTNEVLEPITFVLGCPTVLGNLQTFAGDGLLQI
jgi:flavorubredoxin